MANTPITIGQRFDRLTVIGDGPPITQSNGKRRRSYLVVCDCGGGTHAPAHALRSGNTRSCGCIQREKASARKAAPRLQTGTRFGRLVVQEQVEAYVNRQGARMQQYRCVCDCGSSGVYRSRLLRVGHTKSCGCLSREVAGARLRTHGEASAARRRREYTVWAGMIARCENPKEESFRNYGARGISVCQKWRDSYEAFLSDMGRCPAGMSIERIDNDGNYEPGNCRWATKREQGRNTRVNLIVIYRGREMPLVEACELSGVNYSKVYQRIRAGWPMNRIFNT